MRSPCCLCVLFMHPCIPPNFSVFYVVHSVSKESTRLVLLGTSCFVLVSAPTAFGTKGGRRISEPRKR
jgi:hypothetical protein